MPIIVWTNICRVCDWYLRLMCRTVTRALDLLAMFSSPSALSGLATIPGLPLTLLRGILDTDGHSVVGSVEFLRAEA